MGQEEHEMSNEDFAELKSMMQDIQEIKKALLGDYACEGLVSRINKLEETISIFKKVLGAIGLAILGLILDAAKGLF